jgi:tRNA A-37 threonylcarbamoyl transferase component Bud32
MRLLVVAERDELRLLMRKHAEIAWPGVGIVEHRLGQDVDFEPAFAAAGFDAVVIAATAPTNRAEDFAVALLLKPEFAPVVLVLLEEAPAAAHPVIRGLHRVYGRKVDRPALFRAVTLASNEHHNALAMLRTRPGADKRYRFGAVTIRGHRCIRQLGSGGMCTIYLAESERAGSVVVLKVFSQVPDVSERVVSFDRFLQEYEIVAGLNHENIVRIYDLGVADDHAYIAMEHFPQGDLRNRLKVRLSAAEALRYTRQIASALDAIHSVGILHRDLKPANIMLRADGSICLIDFGLAKASELNSDLTGTREIFGTPYYMSPEQGHAEEIDARSDLYSLGVVFFEMLVGRKPFTGNTAMEVIYKHKRAELPPLGAALGGYEAVLQRLLAKAPQDRFQSAGELLSALSTLDDTV